MRVSPKAGAVTDVEALNADVFMTTHKDGKVLLLDSRSGDTSLLAQLNDSVTAVTQSASVTYLVSEGAQLGCYDIRMPESPVLLTVSPRQHIDSLAQTVKVSADGSVLALGFQDGRLQAFAMPEMRLIFSEKPHRDVVKSLAWSEKLLFSASYDGSLRQTQIERT